MSAFDIKTVDGGFVYPPELTLRVHTYKEGVLSRVGHDLRLQAARVQLSRDAGQLVAKVAVTDLRVLGAISRGQLDEGALSAGDRRKIEGEIQRKVLNRGAEVRFRLREVRIGGAQLRMEGSLTLQGQTRDLALTGTLGGDRVTLSGSLDQRDFGITPYSAAFGALRVKPEVGVEVSLPTAWATEA